MPLHVPDADALVFGDSIVGTGDGARIWVSRRLSGKRRAWYAERLLPSFHPLLEVGADRLLVTHGPPVLSGGRTALAEALAGPPFFHHP